MGVDFHFLNVGDGDCTIIDFPERIVGSTKKQKSTRLMMVDTNHHDDHDEFEDVILYYRHNFRDSGGNIRPIFRYVTTHPHKDHITGIKKVFKEITVINYWDLDHEFEPEKSGTDWEEIKEDWEFYEANRESKSEPKVLRYTDADKPRPYWDEDRIEVLSPSKELYELVHYKEDGTRRTAQEVGGELNNLSFVLLIHINKIRILLAGDAEAKCWEYILENHADKIKDIDILKAPHHGRESAFHEEAVKLMNPAHIVFSASEDCEFTVPEKYKKAAPHANIYETHSLGSFILRCHFDGTITLH